VPPNRLRFGLDSEELRLDLTRGGPGATFTLVPEAGRLHLSGLNLSTMNFAGDDLHGANLSGANLTGADLAGADLGGANFQRADLNLANLSGANVQGANFGNALWVATTCPDGTDSTSDGGTCTGHL
jgi:hypothetical protein